VRFYARRGEPPCGDAFLGVTQLDAAATRGGFMAMAVTSRRGSGLQPRWHIAIDRYDREERENDYSGQANTEGSVRNHGQKQRVHTSWYWSNEIKPIARAVKKDHY
jgi:hypothetical protein